MANFLKSNLRYFKLWEEYKCIWVSYCRFQELGWLKYNFLTELFKNKNKLFQKCTQKDYLVMIYFRKKSVLVNWSERSVYNALMCWSIAKTINSIIVSLSLLLPEWVALVLWNSVCYPGKQNLQIFQFSKFRQCNVIHAMHCYFAYKCVYR